VDDDVEELSVGSILMTDAERIARDLEIRKSFLFARARVLEEQMPELCYKIAVDGSFIARQELRALDSYG